MNILEDATYSVKMQIITRFSQIKIIIPYLISPYKKTKIMRERERERERERDAAYSVKDKLRVALIYSVW